MWSKSRGIDVCEKLGQEVGVMLEEEIGSAL